MRCLSKLPCGAREVSGVLAQYLLSDLSEAERAQAFQRFVAFGGTLGKNFSRAVWLTTNTTVVAREYP